MEDKDFAAGHFQEQESEILVVYLPLLFLKLSRLLPLQTWCVPRPSKSFSWTYDALHCKNPHSRFRVYSLQSPLCMT